MKHFQNFDYTKPPPSCVSLNQGKSYSALYPLFDCVEQKTGKWCAAHVRMAWEIHRHQQNHLAMNSSSVVESAHRKSEMNHLINASANPLRPPSSLLPGVSTGMPRPGDRGSAGSLMGPSEHCVFCLNCYYGSVYIITRSLCLSIICISLLLYHYYS